MTLSASSTLAPDTLAARLGRERVAVIDVRSRFMFREGAVPGALNIPFGPDFPDRLAQSCPSNADLVVVYGQHASEAQSALTGEVDAEVCVLEGGLDGWRDAGLNVRVSPKRVPKEWREGTT